MTTYRNIEEAQQDGWISVKLTRRILCRATGYQVVDVSGSWSFGYDYEIQHLRSESAMAKTETIWFEHTPYNKWLPMFKTDQLRDMLPTWAKPRVNEVLETGHTSTPNPIRVGAYVRLTQEATEYYGEPVEGVITDRWTDDSGNILIDIEGQANAFYEFSLEPA